MKAITHILTGTWFLLYTMHDGQYTHFTLYSNINVKKTVV